MPSAFFQRKTIAPSQTKEKKEKRTLILIGPEGDFSPTEIEKSTQHNFNPISLGNSRLRTETAAIIAVHTISIKS